MSYNISCFTLSVWLHEALPDGSSVCWKPLELSRRMTPTAQGRVLTPFQADGWLSPGLCPPKTRSPISLLKPESESSAAGVKAGPCYSSSHILCNTSFFNTVRLHSSAQWVTLRWPFIVHSSAFPVFPILWKELHKCQYYHSTAQFFYCILLVPYQPASFKTWRRKTR